MRKFWRWLWRNEYAEQARVREQRAKLAMIRGIDRYVAQQGGQRD